jgi:hypothetical protein
MRDTWAEEILSRFHGREDLGRDGLFEKFFVADGLDKESALSCFEEIEMSYRIPIGILRPDDQLSKLFERAETCNPLRWLRWLGDNEFSDEGLLDELNYRMKNAGTENQWKSIETFDDLVRAWCGQGPVYRDESGKSEAV